MPGLSLRGATGSIRWGYHVAAQLRDWTVTPSKDKPWALRASIVTSDAFKVQQRPLTFATKVGVEELALSIQSLQINGTTLTALLQPPQRKERT